MSEIDDGGYAFPGSYSEKGEMNWYVGLTKRQWFAGMALKGLLANPSTILKQADIPELSFEYADAMLRAGKGEK